MERATDLLIVRRLRDADRLLEVGIGDRTGVAAGLAAAGADVRATDVVEISVPEGVQFRVEDVTTVDDPDAFHQVDTIYALNCPPDLHRPIRDLAERVGATFCFTTLGFDEPAIPVRRESLLEGDIRTTFYTAEPVRNRERSR
ncbi:UPF0146 family protein [Halolamina salifodinae]|uniref:Uncharacterized UPF0146 family protein n=1 Tax=Halolamina salifodinae TaxID=1202767 RepID=A0A8T4GXK5_9EURY|nr:UPF0146 family protein [Halolamina salifodinae]MBP1987747.1 uncharacterized UPF0146 family protein [Halolamina salifodinae]